MRLLQRVLVRLHAIEKPQHTLLMSLLTRLLGSRARRCCVAVSLLVCAAGASIVVRAPEHGIGEATLREETALCLPPIPPSPPPEGKRAYSTAPARVRPDAHPHGTVGRLEV